MKIVALIPAKNEAEMLPVCINSLSEIVDEVIVYDDHSTDNTALVARQAGAIVVTSDFKTETGWPEFEIREYLLQKARESNATHILAIDADEAITPAFAKEARNYFETMKPGDILSLRWITLWKKPKEERVDGVYKNLYKDFAFCDDKTSHHQYAFLGVGRVPHSNGQRIKASYELGGILHFQYVFWNKTQLKQAWYKCAELLQKERSARRINSTYSSTLDGNHVKTNDLPNDWQVPISYKERGVTEYWQYSKLIELFDKHGIENFEPLQIWHIRELSELFVKSLGRKPRSKTFPNWLIRINKLKNKISSVYHA